jgi:CcmD family protein
MPEASDAFASIGYLVAAAAVTIVGLAGYAVFLAQRLRQARARNTLLHRNQR